ncbi:hypothetical protein BDV59DRAFT_202990 [Aspergillus ambiguus]|uniref:uncharacterized protein n=1 Tax=Aspergillus ambiguus TaxID=176160 RepID=UPI003CCCCF22
MSLALETDDEMFKDSLIRYEIGHDASFDPLLLRIILDFFSSKCSAAACLQHDTNDGRLHTNGDPLQPAFEDHTETLQVLEYKEPSEDVTDARLKNSLAEQQPEHEIHDWLCHEGTQEANKDAHDVAPAPSHESEHEESPELQPEKAASSDYIEIQESTNGF